MAVLKLSFDFTMFNYLRLAARLIGHSSFSDQSKPFPSSDSDRIEKESRSLGS